MRKNHRPDSSSPPLATSSRRTAAPSLPLDSLAFALRQAAHICAGVLAGQSLAEGQLAEVPAVARPAVQDLVYGSLRSYGRGDFFLARLLDRPLSDEAVRALLLVALYRLETRPDSVHTVVDQAVLAAGELAAGRCRGLVNAVLRQFLRQQAELTAVAAADPVVAAQLPDWWLAELQRAYPAAWPAIVAAANTPPPMGLRVNRRRFSREQYLAELVSAGIEAAPWGEDEAIHLARPLPVERLPHFASGGVSVQDPGAQQAANWLAPQAGMRVLDACAAPGGKTAHLLEQLELDLLALDLKPSRCRRIEENLGRLGLTAEVRVANCAQPEKWWDGRPFDAILADVPCTASGVVRRNPDAKWLRRPEDVASFAATQARIIDALWPLLRPGGRMLYATCSLFAAENGEQMESFRQRHSDARCLRQEQLLPTDASDGFFYCLLEKAR
ncbi:16S rRNA (cytosine(967)-C(5))-methyltransferase RsmB [Dechloromonas sp. ZY10]|uniref:16S rRNA (cytosine(967)-C(5))-methyltransferase RsmB n=1 Tax=Dechloromonas aquae TaxID=2664436 RepID=UPI003529A13C